MANKQLLRMLLEKSVKRGAPDEFKLKSGRTSDFYVDARNTTLHGLGMLLVADAVCSRIAEGVRGIGGLTMGADPIVCAAVHQWNSLLDSPMHMHGFLVRKEMKGHGIKDRVVGLSNFQPGTKVCVVEDTTTTGSSLYEAIEAAVEAGLDVVQCITLVDRQEGATEFLASRGYTLEAITTRAELLGE